MNSCFARLLIRGTLCVTLAGAAPALAADPAHDEPKDAKATAPETLPPGPLTGVRDALHDAGVDVLINFVNLYSNSPRFGFNPGKSGNFGFLMFDTTYHLTDTLRLKWQETINVPTYRQDKYLFDVANAFYSTDPNVDSKTDLTRLTLEGSFFDNRLELEGGRMNMWPEFFRSEYCGGLGCIAQTRALVLNGEGNTLAQWSGRIGYNIEPNLSLGAFVSEDNPTNWQTGSGWDWGRGDSSGYIAVAHLAQRESFTQSDNPLSFEIGGYRRSTSYEDALYGSGWGNPTFGQNQLVKEHDGGSNGIFAQGRKVVWSRPDGTPFPENIAVYGGVFHTFGDGQAYPWEAYGGMEYGGFWADNPSTSVGATLHYIGLSEARAQYETNARQFFSGVYERQRKDTFQFDLHTRIGVGAGFLELGGSYVLNPNTAFVADYSRDRMNDGWTIYAGLFFDIGATLGLSKPPQF